MTDRGYCLACRVEAGVGPGGDHPCATCGAPTRLRGRWRVVDALAQGGSARVFRAVDTEGEREVALKVLELAQVEDWKQVELFERQLPLLRMLHHPGIPEVYDAFEIDVGGRTLLVLAQSLHRGPNLRDALAAGLRFDEPSARAFLHRMLDILAYLHGFSPPILHRDIKPANILLELPDGAAEAARGRELAARLAQAQPVLIDFDTARGVAIDARTADGTMVGSAGYVPLEQLAGRPVPASDLYALGVTMIAALSQRDVLELPVERSRLQFRGFVNVSRELQDVLERMIEPIVEDRFASVAAVRRALAGSTRAPAVSESRAAQPIQSASAEQREHGGLAESRAVSGKRTPMKTVGLGLGLAGSVGLGLWLVGSLGNERSAAPRDQPRQDQAPELERYESQVPVRFTGHGWLTEQQADGSWLVKTSEGEAMFLMTVLENEWRMEVQPDARLILDYAFYVKVAMLREGVNRDGVRFRPLFVDEAGQSSPRRLPSSLWLSPPLSVTSYCYRKGDVAYVKLHSLGREQVQLSDLPVADHRKSPAFVEIDIEEVRPGIGECQPHGGRIREVAEKPAIKGVYFRGEAYDQIDVRVRSAYWGDEHSYPDHFNYYWVAEVVNNDPTRTIEALHFETRYFGASGKQLETHSEYRRSRVIDASTFPLLESRGMILVELRNHLKLQPSDEVAYKEIHVQSIEWR